MRHLGIDFGSKRVGLALSDEAATMGFPHAVVPNDGRLIDYVRTIITAKHVERVVIGESRSLGGEENPIAKFAKAFARELERDPGIEVAWESELYTTQEARRDFEGVRTTSRDAVDASAAAIILSSFLDRQKHATLGQS